MRTDVNSFFGIIIELELHDLIGNGFFGDMSRQEELELNWKNWDTVLLSFMFYTFLM